ncbi:MAG: helix-turn-helix domain-containing protein [Proteobacteria bacterium]|nr:helix-turn-helix domain-containing protein [Pseudomonadota bacterium]MDA0967366.1 helix-turn-helix domain-containing protein [Pseudomonadota bacterium]
MEDEILTIKEVSEYLKIKEKTTYSLAAKGEIPGFKVGGSWRFRKNEISRWILDQERKSISNADGLLREEHK